VPKLIPAALAILAVASALFAGTPAKPKKRRHTVAAASSPLSRRHSTAAGKTALARGTTAKGTMKTGARNRKGKTARTPPRSYQQAPTADRYKEIQQALASKGYFQGEPTGQWSADSADALKRFQADQSLMPDGKINSLSLIALGLGPKRLTAKTDATPATPTVAPPAPPR
jgi:hypothetical protein